MFDGPAGFLVEAKQKIIELQIELEGLAAKKAALVPVISAYEQKFRQIPQKSIELGKRQRAKLSSEKVYLMVKERHDEEAITESSEVGYVVIIDPAAVPWKPVRPILWLNLLLGGLLGLGMGVAIVGLRSTLDIRVRSPEDLTRHGHLTLATIGLMKWRRANGRNGPVVNGTKLDFHLVSHLNPSSSFAESYRHLKTSLQYARSNNPVKSILVTSPNPREGKSTTACNLAIAFAEAEVSTLLVDADMRRPAIHTMFGLQKEPGLTDLLMGEPTFEKCIHTGVLAHVDVVCSGTAPRNPAAILASRRMEVLLGQLARDYDIILIDSAPLHVASDASVLSTRVDGTVIVVRAGMTKMPALQGGSKYLEGIGAQVLGVVLNGFDVRKTYRVSDGAEGYGYYNYRYNGFYHATQGESRRK
jgi:tyrosine-protein kinase Etk/Wzc